MKYLYVVLLAVFSVTPARACTGVEAYTFSVGGLTEAYSKVAAKHDFKNGTITLYGQVPHASYFKKLVDATQQRWHATNGAPMVLYEPHSFAEHPFLSKRLSQWRWVYAQTLTVPLGSAEFRSRYDDIFPHYEEIAKRKGLSFEHACMPHAL